MVNNVHEYSGVSPFAPHLPIFAFTLTPHLSISSYPHHFLDYLDSENSAFRIKLFPLRPSTVLFPLGPTPYALFNWGFFILPGRDGFESSRSSENGCLTQPPADDLKTHRQSFGSPSARNGDGRKSGHGDRIG